MSGIHIVTDSTSDIPAEILKQYDNITVVPLKVMFGQEVFRDGVDLSPAEFYRRLTATKEIPRTSQPSPGEFLEVYQKLADQEQQIISIHLSSHLSGTVQSARTAGSILNYQDIEIIDSLSASMGIGLIVLAAANAAKNGHSYKEIIDLVIKIRNNLKIYFLVDSLEYLQKGGRIGKARAFLGTLLNIKPILRVNEGIVHPYEKIRGKAKALNRLIEITSHEITPGTSVECCILHAAEPKGANRLKDMLLEKFPGINVIFADVGPVIGTHVGPGTLGIIFYTY
ncbi:DegV family protein [Desulfolucanica intricata]|uniref:DegV family protein n=1 Tax=Desulfolucanica intricata TaxID=1285191 RepID=UPI00082B0FF9|nr:DegV family protein [Desulfolucanica intricata]